MALGKFLMGIGQKSKETIPPHLRKFAKEVSQIKERSIHIFDNPSLRQEHNTSIKPYTVSRGLSTIYTMNTKSYGSDNKD
ncbi:hypothetical protein C5167_012959 [Papaver somniferum]|uniref:Uncharacterized protein n=1 Tax=Papaver somniferum TaxID=3469 RepID=A0A4Y7J385_PAPSO|nr:hypothetical protein C5167_012959 [Papaver somniferum]